MSLSRVSLVRASGILSSYPLTSQPKLDVSCFQDKAFIAPDMFSALVILNRKVNQKGGNLYITDLLRPWDMQAEARRKYESGEKKAFVAKPGGSFHGAGRAMDIDVMNLQFEDTPKDLWLQTFWDIAKPLGFRPIISSPDITASEAWHFDFPGTEWTDAYDTLPYGEAAKCCTLDVGMWNPDMNSGIVKKMFIQAQCIRLGAYSVGKVDGIFGPKTYAALSSLGFSDTKNIESLIKLLTCKS
jgi:hypothetical protein